MDEIPNVMPIMVSFFTYGWVQQSIRCFQQHFPELKVLVIDNNPTSFTQMENWNWGRSKAVNKRWRSLYKYSLAERDWLKDQSNVILVQPDRKGNKQITHGLCVDFALNWCKENSVDIMLCVEPDISFNDVKWFYNSLEPLLDDKYWITGKPAPISKLDRWQTAIHPCPIMLKVDKIKHSFNHMNLDKRYYDFSQMVWHRCNEKGRAKLVSDMKDFEHFWHGSYQNIARNERNFPLVTFL